MFNRQNFCFKNNWLKLINNCYYFFLQLYLRAFATRSCIAEVLLFSSCTWAQAAGAKVIVVGWGLGAHFQVHMCSLYALTWRCVRVLCQVARISNGILIVLLTFPIPRPTCHPSIYVAAAIVVVAGFYCAQMHWRLRPSCLSSAQAALFCYSSAAQAMSLPFHFTSFVTKYLHM